MRRGCWTVRSLFAGVLCMPTALVLRDGRSPRRLADESVTAETLGARAEQLARDPRPRPGRGSSRSRPPPASRRRRAARARARRSARRPSRPPGCCTRSATAATWASATGLIAGPGEPAGAPAEPRLARRRRGAGASAIARSVLISETASAPASSAACAHSADVGGVGRELDDQRLARCTVATAAHDRLELRAGRRRCRGRSATLGQDTFSSIAAISCALRRRPRPARASSAALEPITLVISGTAELAVGPCRGVVRPRELRAGPRSDSRRGPCWAGRSS